jgi:hypothetical protein
MDYEDRQADAQQREQQVNVFEIKPQQVILEYVIPDKVHKQLQDHGCQACADADKNAREDKELLCADTVMYPGDALFNKIDLPEIH